MCFLLLICLAACNGPCLAQTFLGSQRPLPCSGTDKPILQISCMPCSGIFYFFVRKVRMFTCHAANFRSSDTRDPMRPGDPHATSQACRPCCSQEGILYTHPCVPSIKGGMQRSKQAGKQARKQNHKQIISCNKSSTPCLPPGFWQASWRALRM